jgi:hypothetical protein
MFRGFPEASAHSRRHATSLHRRGKLVELRIGYRFKVAFEEEFYVGIGTDLGKAETNLRSVLPRRWFSFWGRKASLYVLDMYFPTGTTNTSEQRAELAEAWGNCGNYALDLAR